MSAQRRETSASSDFGNEPHLHLVGNLNDITLPTLRIQEEPQTDHTYYADVSGEKIPRLILLNQNTYQFPDGSIEQISHPMLRYLLSMTSTGNTVTTSDLNERFPPKNESTKKSSIPASVSVWNSKILRKHNVEISSIHPRSMPAEYALHAYDPGETPTLKEVQVRVKKRKRDKAHDLKTPSTASRRNGEAKAKVSDNHQVENDSISSERWVAPDYDNNGREYTPEEKEMLEYTINKKKELYNLAYRLLGNTADAEDALQESTFRAFSRCTRYKRQNDNSARSWTMEIVTHYCLDQFRARKRRVRNVTLGIVPESARFIDDIEDTEDTIIGREKKGEIEKALAELPMHLRIVLELRELMELRYNEIADILGLPISTVRMRIFRAKALARTLPSFKKLRGREVHNTRTSEEFAAD